MTRAHDGWRRLAAAWLALALALPAPCVGGRAAAGERAGAPARRAAEREQPPGKRSLFDRLLRRGDEQPRTEPRGDEPRKGEDDAAGGEEENEFELNAAAGQVGPQTLPVADQLAYELPLTLRAEAPAAPAGLPACACSVAVAPLEADQATAPVDDSGELHFAADVHGAADARLLALLGASGVFGRVERTPPAVTFLASQANVLRAEQLKRFFQLNPALDLLLYGSIPQWGLGSVDVRLTLVRPDLSVAFTRRYRRTAKTQFDRKHPEQVTGAVLDRLLDELLVQAVSDIAGVLAEHPPAPRPVSPPKTRRAAGAPAARRIALPEDVPEKGDLLVKYYLKSRIEAKRFMMIEEFAGDDGSPAPEDAFLMVPELIVEASPVMPVAGFEPFDLRTFLLSAQRQRGKSSLDLRKFFADKDRQKRRNKYQVGIATRTLRDVPVGIHLVRLVHDSRVLFYDFYGERLAKDDERTFLGRVGASSRMSLVGTSRTGTLLTNTALRTRYALVKVKPGEKTVLAAQVERTTAGTRLAYKFSPVECVDFGRHYMQNAGDVMRALVNAHQRKDRAEFEALMRDNYLLAVKQAAGLLTALQLVSDRVDKNMRSYFQDELTRIVQFDSTNTVVDDGLFFGYDRERPIDESVTALSEAEARDLYKAFFLHLEMTYAERRFAREVMAELYARFLGNRLIAAEIERRAKDFKTGFLKLSLQRQSQEQMVREHMLRQVQRYVQYAVMRAQVYDEAYDFVATVAAEARAKTGDTYLDQVLAAYRRDGFPTTLKFVPPAKPILLPDGQARKDEDALKAARGGPRGGAVRQTPAKKPDGSAAAAAAAAAAASAADRERARQATALRFGELTPEQVEANSVPIRDLVDALIPHPRDYRAFVAAKKQLDRTFTDITDAGRQLEGIARDRYRRPRQYDGQLAKLRGRLEELRAQAESSGLLLDAKRAHGYLRALGEEDDDPSRVLAVAAADARTGRGGCMASRASPAAPAPAAPARPAARRRTAVAQGIARSAPVVERATLEQSFRDLDKLGFKHDLGYYGLILALRAQGDAQVKWAVEALRAARRVGDVRVMAQALLLVARRRQAEQQYQHAAQVLEPLLGPATRRLDLDVKTQVILLAADVLTASGHPTEAERVLRMGLDEYEARVGELSADVSGGVERYLTSRTLVFEETAGSMYECLAGVLLAQSRPHEALEAVERNKGRTLLEIFLRHQQVGERVKGGTRAQRAELLDGLVARRESEQELLSADPTAGEEVRRRLRELDERLAELRRTMGDEQRLFDGVKVVVPPLEPLLRSVPADVLVVSYGLVGDRLVAFLLGDGRMEPVVMPLDAQARDDLAQLRAFQVPGALDGVRLRADLQADYVARMHRLYGVLVRPFEARLQGKQQLVLVPQAVLAVVPFAALQDDDGRFLFERVALSVVPNLQTLALLERRRGAGRTVGAADPTRRGAAARQRAVAAPKAADQAPAGKGRQAAPPPPRAVVLGNPSLDLVGAEAEARQVAEIYGVAPVLRESVTKAALVSAFGIEKLILATHATAQPDNVLESHIVVAGETEAERRLAIGEILSRDLRLSSDLVALSACESAVVGGGAERFERVGTEVLGLNFTFLYQGAGGVLASLWRVHDQATRHIMIEFHRAYESGQPAARALRQAQLSWLEHAREALAQTPPAPDGAPARPAERGGKRSGRLVSAPEAANEAPPGDPSRNPYYFAPFQSYSGWS